MGDYLTEKQMCDWLKISRSTIIRWRKEGLPFVKVNKSVRFDKDKVQAWLDQKEQK